MENIPKVAINDKLHHYMGKNSIYRDKHLKTDPKYVLCRPFSKFSKTPKADKVKRIPPQGILNLEEKLIFE